MNESYAPWFQSRTGNLTHEWQTALDSAPGIKDRLIRIPTGFGKTAGVVT